MLSYKAGESLTRRLVKQRALIVKSSKAVHSKVCINNSFESVWYGALCWNNVAESDQGH